MNSTEREAVIKLLHSTKIVDMYLSSYVNHSDNPRMYGKPDPIECLRCLQDMQLDREVIRRLLEQGEITTQSEIKTKPSPKKVSFWNKIFGRNSNG